jgi:hypothetical protein
MPPDVERLHIKFDGEWLCAVVDRSRRVNVEGQLLRDGEAASTGECEACASHAESSHAESSHAESSDSAYAEAQAAEFDEEVRQARPAAAASRQLTAAAVSLHGVQMLVVLVPVEVVRSSGEADMLLSDLSGRFGGLSVVLMGQQDDGSPVYHGDSVHLGLLADVPLENMPWQTYDIP